MERRHDQEFLESSRRRLLDIRRKLLVSILGTEQGLRMLEEFDRGEPETEERAQEDALARVLGRLEDREQRELRDVIDALERIRKRTYGHCERCHREIARARLDAVPTTRHCRQCAAELERRPQEGMPAPDASTAPETPAFEYDGMNDEDLRAAVFEQVRATGDGFERIDAVVQDGHVRLEGEVPTEQHREIARDVVKDRMGLEVEQNLRVDALAFESSGRQSGSELPREEPEVRRALGTEEQTEDLFESEEKGLDYSPPDQPVPGPRKG